MDASRLLEISHMLLQVERAKKIQTNLNKVKSSLDNLIQRPTQPEAQTAFSSTLDGLRSLLNTVRDEFEPAQTTLLHQIGAADYFLGNFADNISDWVSKNTATPAVAQEQLTTKINEREAYLNNIKQLEGNLLGVGVKINNLEPGQAEIGFLLPRELFDNNLENLIRELNVVKMVIRAFSEAATGTVQQIEVRQISTSDPLFFFGLDLKTIVMIGAAVTWALSTWKGVEEIRNIRAQTEKIERLKGTQIENVFEETIKKEIENAIDSKTDEIIKAVGSQGGRENEQERHLNWALRSILTRVERGMIVEIRVLPPPKQHIKDDDGSQTSSLIYDELATITNELVFPKIEGSPILELPSFNPDQLSQVRDQEGH